MKNQKPSEDPVADNLQIHERTFHPPESMQVTVGISPEGVLWPDDSRNAHLIVMLGVPAAMVTGYLTTMQKLLRWHKNAPLGPNGEGTGDEASLLASLQQALQ